MFFNFYFVIRETELTINVSYSKNLDKFKSFPITKFIKSHKNNIAYGTEKSLTYWPTKLTDSLAKNAVHH